MHFLGARKHQVDQAGPMGLGAIPHNKNAPLDMLAESTQKRNDTRGGNILARMEREVKSYPFKARRNRQRGNGRHFAMPPAYLVQDRGFTPWRPGTPYKRSQQEAAFVYKDDGGVQRPGFFLMRGQSAFIQWRIAFSSLSRASRSGFCGDQPIARKSRGRYR